MSNDGSTMLIQISDDELKEIQTILHDIVPSCTVWAFGSRVHGVAKQFSDLDIALLTSEPLSLSKKADLAAAFDESDLAFKVDIVDWAITSDSFRRIIETEKIVLQLGSNK